MKKAILLSAGLSAVVTALLVLSWVEISDQMQQPKADVYHDVQSETLKETREILVHLPKGYSAEKQYPVIYVLDGGSNDFSLAAVVEILSQTATVKPTIVVGIPNTYRNRDLTPPFMFRQTGGAQKGEGNRFLTFLETELFPMIASKYATSGHRLLVGHSRGGLYAFYAALEKPSLFDAVFCFSPAFWRDDQAMVQRVDKKRSTDFILLPWLYLSLGTEENDKMKQGFASMLTVLEAKVPGRFTGVYTEQANHHNNLYQSAPKALAAWAKWQGAGATTEATPTNPGK